ncbi:hypothetical protein PFISCL1PPCAC_22503, partial [Pristionchus fissidentatus]
VVAAEQEERLRVAQLVPEQEEDRLQVVLASVNVVAQEEVVGGGWKASLVEESEQIGELTVNVSADLDGRLDFDEGRLLEEKGARLVSDVGDLSWTDLRRQWLILVCRPEHALDQHFRIDLDGNDWKV